MKIIKTFPQLKGKWGKINLNKESVGLNLDFTNSSVCENWINSIHNSQGINYSFGGFLEDRSNFLKKHYNKRKKIFIHLGIDYTVPAKTQVALTEEAIVEYIRYDYSKGGWGKMVLFSLRNKSLYILYGHLKKMPRLKVGQKCIAGQIIGIVGKKNENGGWFPHLHVQLMTPKFITMHKGNFRKIDGYTYKNSPLIKEVLNPQEVIY